MKATTNTFLLTGLPLLLLLLLLSQPQSCLAASISDSNNANTNTKMEVQHPNLRRLGLEMYQRYTPPPAPVTNTSTTTESEAVVVTESGSRTDGPTGASTTDPTVAPTIAPTDEPTVAPVAPAPTPTPTDAATEPQKDDKNEGADDETETESETILEQEREVEQTEEPTPPPIVDIVEEEVMVEEGVAVVEEEPVLPAVAQQQQPQPQGDLYSSTLQYNESLGEVFVEFSLWSPTKDPMELDFMNLKLGVCASMDSLVCDVTDPVRVDQGPEYCAVRDDVLIPNSVHNDDKATISSDDITIIALATTNVNDASGVVHNSNLLTWTTWRMTWNVVQLGSNLLQHIEDDNNMYQATEALSEEEKYVKGLALLQQMMAVEMERTLRQGGFEDDINAFMDDSGSDGDGDYTIKSSVVGEEVTVFGSLMPMDGSWSNTNTAAAAAGLQQQGTDPADNEDGDEGNLMIVFFFAGLGLACCVIVTLLYFSFRSRRATSRNNDGGNDDNDDAEKQNVIIVDDTSKSCTDATPESNRSSPSRPLREESEPVFVIEHEQAIQEEPLQQQSQHRRRRLRHDHDHNNDRDRDDDQQSQKDQSQEDDDDDQSMDEEEEVPTRWEADADSGGDLESRGVGAQSMAQSMGQSTMYTAGSGISAITGVSGLEHSDTWSVGSMSIDLADWG